MQKLIQIMLSPRAVAFLLVAVLVLTIYFVGYLSGADWPYLNIAAAVVVALSLAIVVLQRLGAAKSANALESALRAQGQAQLGGTRPDQRASIEELKGQFDESLELLRKSKMGRGALHSIPWYVLVGPPGSGKSTLLRQSGLSFPYMTKGRSAIRGLGGTKNCDWWFADRGILLDTAGRFMTETEDREEWMAFLRMIKKGRKHRPINGAIVAVGIPEVLEGSEKELQATAENVRDRIDELTRELGAVFPIYLVFTKCDRLRGFVETFDTLNKDQRKQVWGFTFPFTRGKEFVVAEQFGKEFDELYRSLCVRRIDLLASDHFKKRKAQVYAFPMQFLRVKERLQSFLGQLQAENPYQEASPIRGVYFTSGTQEGTTIDRILKVVRPAELEHDVPEDSRRCYFVDDLFNQVVFDDAALATPSAKSAQRAKWLRLGVAVALGLASISVVVMDWNKRSAFGVELGNVTLALGELTDPITRRKSLDSQLGMLENPNIHIQRSEVEGPLERRYLRSLQDYASEQFVGHVGGRVEDAKKVLRADPPSPFAAILAADQELKLLGEGLGAFATKDESAAMGLWKSVIGKSEVDARHFKRLLGGAGLGPGIKAADTNLANVREELDRYLQAKRQEDLAEGLRLTAADLFPKASARLGQTVQFRDCSLYSLKEHWSEDCLNLSVTGPLWSRACSDPNASHVEGFLEDLRADFENAKNRPGKNSKQSLSSVSGEKWLGFLEAEKSAFLADLKLKLDQNWVTLLGRLEEMAALGKDHGGTDDKIGVGRLVAMPMLVGCYKVARKVVHDQAPLTDADRKVWTDDLETAKRDFATETWALALGTLKSDAGLEDVTKRVSHVKDWLANQERRAKSSGLSREFPNLGSPLVQLELALLRAVANREWAACRRAVDAVADSDLRPAWGKLTSLYPFNRAALAHANASDLGPALLAMLNVSDTIDAIAKLDLKSQFELDEGFAKNIQQARELVKLLYGGEAVASEPRLELTVRMLKEGSVEGVKLKSETREAEDGGDVDWTLGQVESLWIEAQLSDGTRLSIGSIPLSGTLPQGVLANGRLSIGMWNLKRLCDLGTYTTDKSTVESVLVLKAREDKLRLRVRVTRLEVAEVFSANWPGTRYNLSSRIWAKQ